MVVHWLFDQLNALGAKYSYFYIYIYIYMWALHVSALFPYVQPDVVTSALTCTGHQVLSAHILTRSVGFLLCGPTDRIGL
jgi:hypothetical protein